MRWVPSAKGDVRSNMARQMSDQCCGQSQVTKSATWGRRSQKLPALLALANHSEVRSSTSNTVSPKIVERRRAPASCCQSRSMRASNWSRVSAAKSGCVKILFPVLARSSPNTRRRQTDRSLCLPGEWRSSLGGGTPSSINRRSWLCGRQRRRRRSWLEFRRDPGSRHLQWP